MTDYKKDTCTVLEDGKTPYSQAFARLIRAHEGYFDITEPFMLGDIPFDALAQYHQQAERYVLSKKAKLWGYSTHEYIFFKQLDFLDAEQLDALVHEVKTRGAELVSPDEDHMASYLSLVIVASEIDTVISQRVKKTRYRKNIAGGFKGWIDLRLAVVDMKSRSVCTNGQGKALRDTIEANVFSE